MRPQAPFKAYLIAFAAIAGAPLAAAAEPTGWLQLFDGKSLDDWRASDAPGTFSVANGEMVVKGPRSHLFYMGPIGRHDFRNFEFRTELMTKPNANSGVYIHTEFQAEGWPNKGYEVQVNNSHSDKSRTGGLWGIQDYYEVPSPDNVWFTLYIKVEGKHILTKVNDKVISDYVEPEQPNRPAQFKERLLSHGTFAIQGHDPGSEIHYRNMYVKILP
jgi:hypothetical protein